MGKGDLNVFVSVGIKMATSNPNLFSGPNVKCTNRHVTLASKSEFENSSRPVTLPGGGGRWPIA